MPKPAAPKTQSWFNSAESLLAISSIGGSVASLVFQQVAFAAATSLSLSLAVGLNLSNNRRRLYEVTQQHQSIVNNLEQQYSKEREFLNEAIRYLPNRSEQVEIESRLTNLETYKNEFPSRIEGQIQDLEKQFYNSLLPDVQHQFGELGQLVNQLQTSTIDATKLHQHLSNEIQSSNKQLQALDIKVSHFTVLDNSEINSIRDEIKFIYELLGDIQKQPISSLETTDSSLLVDLEHQLVQTQQLFHYLKASSEDSNQLTQHLAREIKSLQEQVRSISINISKRLEAVQAEIQSRLLALEESDYKIRNNITELLEKIKPPKEGIVPPTPFACEHCRKTYKSNPIQGGSFRNYKFCSYACKRQYENINGEL